MKKIVLPTLVCLAALSAPKASLATTVEKLTFDQVVERADSVVVAKVTGKSSAWDAHRRIWTTVTFNVEEVISGNPDGRTITRKFLGGEVNGLTMKVGEMPVFNVGEKVVLFSYDKQGLYCPLVGWNQGKYIVEKLPSGQEVVLNSRRKPANLLGDGEVRALSALKPVTRLQFATKVRQLKNSR